MIVDGEKINNDTYLGDGLYASFDGYQIKLYAWDGENVTNAVYLDGSVLIAFQHFVAKITEASQ